MRLSPQRVRAFAKNSAIATIKSATSLRQPLIPDRHLGTHMLATSVKMRQSTLRIESECSKCMQHDSCFPILQPSLTTLGLLGPASNRTFRGTRRVAIHISLHHLLRLGQHSATITRPSPPASSCLTSTSKYSRRLCMKRASAGSLVG